jgi:hypothetical protein
MDAKVADNASQGTDSLGIAAAPVIGEAEAGVWTVTGARIVPEPWHKNEAEALAEFQRTGRGTFQANPATLPEPPK